MTAVVVLAVAVTGATLAGSGEERAAPAGRELAVSTAPVERGDLAATVSSSGTLTYRAGADGSPYPVINQAGGTYTQLPAVGDEVACGDVLYRVDDRPVLLLCGSLPAYRDLQPGATGDDVRQLNQDLASLGPDGGGVDPGSDTFTSTTRDALAALQAAKGLAVTGSLAVGDAVFLPGPLRIAAVAAQPGAPAQPGTQLLGATSNVPEVLVSLQASQQGRVSPGDRAQITLPDNASAPGKVDRLGAVSAAPAPDGAQGPGGPGTASLPVHVDLDDPAQARGLEQAPVRVEITTEGVHDVLSVPVVALVGKAGGGMAVEVARGGGRRALVAVRLGLFDTSAGRVQVDGALRRGDAVVVPTS